jgi:hypothetical protein
MTVPNWEKEDWVRSSMGMRIDGQGIEGGILVFEKSESKSWRRNEVGLRACA